MTDKVQKIREEVERLYNQSLADENRQADRGLECAANVSYGKSKACKELLSFIDSLQEEPVSSIWHDASEEPNGDNSIVIAYDNGCTIEPSFKDFKSYSEWGTIKKSYRVKQWAYIDDLLNLSNVQRTVKERKKPVSEELEKAANAYISNENNYSHSRTDTFKAGAKWQETKDDSTTEDLGEYINELSKQFPEVSFAKLSRIAVRVSRWQQNQDVKNKLPKVTDRTELDEYAYQCAYDMSNDWAIDNPTWKDVEDACKLGAKWGKEQAEIQIKAQSMALAHGCPKEEPASEKLEEAASSFARKDSEGVNNPANFYYTIADKARIFKAGAKWQLNKIRNKYGKNRN